jgi:hypothetical protein
VWISIENTIFALTASSNRKLLFCSAGGAGLFHIDTKPSTLDLLPDFLNDDDDITFVGAIQEAKNVQGPITRCKKIMKHFAISILHGQNFFAGLSNNAPIYFLKIQNRYFVLCEDFAKRVLQKSSWKDMLQTSGRTDESLEVHNLSIKNNLNILSQMPGFVLASKFYSNLTEYF